MTDIKQEAQTSNIIDTESCEKRRVSASSEQLHSPITMADLRNLIDATVIPPPPPSPSAQPPRLLPASYTDHNPDILQRSVQAYIDKNPDKHKLAQSYGGFLMSSPFMTNNSSMHPVKQGEDFTGKDIFLNELISKIRYYGIQPDELTEYEITALREKYGETWREYIDSIISDE